MIKSYASYFASYLLNNLKKEEISNLKSIILFGSAARGDASKDSDVDIFIDVLKKNKKLENRISKIVEEFYKSREAVLFKAKGIGNKINVIIGKLVEWKDLKNSIESTAIVLYGRYTSTGIAGKKYLLFFWDNIKRNRGAFLNKLYGFKVRERRYKGLVEIYGGKKLGKSSIMIPAEYNKEVVKLLEHYGVNARIIEIYA